MSQVQKVSLDQARLAQQSLIEKFARDFMNAANPTNGIGLTRINNAEYGIKVNLTHEPTPDEKKFLPDVHESVKVKYEIIGGVSKRNPQP